MSKEELLGNRVYRHFKGDYYLLHGIFSDTDNPHRKLVSYSSLSNGSLWSREVTEFSSLVPEESQIFNITGQKYRFELVTEFNSGVGTASTQCLEQELLSRKDSEIVISPVDIFNVEYMVVQILDDRQKWYNILNVTATYDEAFFWAQKHHAKEGNISIFKTTNQRVRF